MIKNILLPGGIGYIGSHVALELLLNTEHNVTIIDNYYNSSPLTLERIFESISCDITKGDNI
jgi:UDP-glucose 4-epimerase